MKQENISNPDFQINPIKNEEIKEKLLVGIGPSPNTAKIIRWTHRLASTMNAPWFAINVQTSKILSEKFNEQLSSNIKLAQDLGAEIIRIYDDDIINGLLTISRQKNVTQIIIGKPFRNQFWDLIRRRDFVNRLLSESGDIDIYVFKGGKQKDSIRESRFLPEIKSRIIHYFYSVSAILIMAGICFPLKDIIGYQTVGLLLLFTITLLPLFVGRGPILVATILSSIVWNFFFIPPLFTFHIDNFHDIITLLVNFSVALVMGFLTAKIRSQQKAVKIREETAVALYNFTDSLWKSNSKDDILENSVNYISDYFNAMVTIFLSDEKGNLILFKNSDGFQELSNKETQVAEWSLNNSKIAGKYTDNIPIVGGTYFPLCTLRVKLGVIGIQYRKNKKPTIDKDVLLNNFIKQLTTALEKVID